MASFDLEDFLARSTDASFADTTLAGILKALPPLSKEGPWIAGGALRRTLLGKEPESDFDFFFRDAGQLADFTAALESSGLVKVRETAHHVHYRGKLGDSGIDRDIQCIRFAFYQNSEAVIDSFDYTICQLAFDGKTLTLGEFTLWDLGRRRLAIHKITYPVATMRRMLKYTAQGFTACAGCMATILTETASKPEILQQIGITYVD
ncbi:hypothetical protein [Bradyrhizobium sp. SZCCHNRI1073]|uniref:hypothetical protein n=1 Tax=Bradyrhizobium sp. SZCCHNRI1073 TaxID=3057280 RepID=UPI002915E158|nr:hypothetical protein [Bradyrhizobium sp. SZCCHNRI1073]